MDKKTDVDFKLPEEENRYNLPEEENAKIGADEMNGEYVCKKCKGWGYINENRSSIGEMSPPPISICPECRGGGIVDWARRPRQN